MAHAHDNQSARDGAGSDVTRSVPLNEDNNEVARFVRYIFTGFVLSERDSETQARIEREAMEERE